MRCHFCGVMFGTLPEYDKPERMFTWRTREGKLIGKEAICKNCNNRRKKLKANFPTFIRIDRYRAKDLTSEEKKNLKALILTNKKYEGLLLEAIQFVDTEFRNISLIERTKLIEAYIDDFCGLKNERSNKVMVAQTSAKYQNPERICGFVN
jgi:hypothetical protein